MENNAVEVKTFFGCGVAVIGYISGAVNELFIVLGILMIFDFFLGSTAGMFTSGFDKAKAVKGAIKKLGYMFLVALGVLADFVVMYIGRSLGTDLNTNGMFGYAITCYLIGTEGLSCLKALNILGLPIPKFLEKAFGNIKNQAGKVLGTDDNEVNKE